MVFHNKLQEFQFYDKYSRWNRELNRRETWAESIQRSVDFLRELSENKLPEQDYQDIYNAMYNMEVFPSMRLFAMAGEAGRRDNNVLYNCSYCSIDSLESMKEVLSLSMAGCGVGFSVEKEYIDQLPKPKERTGLVKSYQIPDTAEGWCDAFYFGLQNWFDGNDVEFDYSLIRPAGTPLKTKTGRASGPKPLQELFNVAKKIIRNSQNRKLETIEVYDIVTKIGDCAVSGGSRRSATICLFDKNDDKMLHAKDYGWWKFAPQRANANNSVVIDEDLTREEWAHIMYIMHNGGGGEPGFFIRKNVGKFAPRRKDNEKFGVNPCFHGDTLIHTKEGHIPIKDLVGKNVEIWNGKNWVFCNNFRVTGRNQQLILLWLENGEELRVTPNHTMILYNDRRIEAKHLHEGDLLKGTTAPDSLHNDSIVKIRKIMSGGFAEKVYCCTEFERHELALSIGIQISQCGEINLRPYELCNLSQAILRNTDTIETLRNKIRIATILGTIQSLATYFPNLRQQWKDNCDEERLLGVDITGQLDNISLLTEDNLLGLKQLAIDTNKKYAEILGINQSVAITAIKPSGNSSILFDCSPGLHPRWSKYYIRRLRVNANSPIRQLLEYHGLTLHPENGQKYETANTLVVEFPVKSPDDAICRNDFTAMQQLEHWRKNKLFYTEHNPSMTCYYKPEELEQIIDWIFENQDIVGGISFLPGDDHYYPLAPYEEITKEKYEEMLSIFPEIDFSLLQYFETEDNTSVSQEIACVAGVCEL